MKLRSNKRVACSILLACSVVALLFKDAPSQIPGGLRSLSSDTKTDESGLGRDLHETPNGCSDPPCQNSATWTPSLNGRRSASMDLMEKFSFVHISKCAGSSWIRELWELLPPHQLYPPTKYGDEYSVAYQNKIYGDAKYHLISLKSPRHHVWSQFTQCKHGAWGYRQTKGTSFQRSGDDAADDVVDFDSWLSHFLDADGKRPEGMDYYNCYHPANFQARFLTSDREPEKGEWPGYVSHGVKGLPKATMYEPDLDVARHTYWQQDWVALAEFFHESKCLLYSRLHPKSPKIEAYIDSQCVCPQPPSEDIREVHHSSGHRSTMLDLPEGILAKVGTLTSVDVAIYREALLQFFREISWLESEGELNRRVLCEPTLRRLEPELAYLGINVTVAYHNASRKGIGEEFRMETA